MLIFEEEKNNNPTPKIVFLNNQNSIDIQVPRVKIENQLIFWAIFIRKEDLKEGPHMTLEECRPQMTQWQIKVVNKSLGKLLRCLVGEHVSQWDLILLQVKFTYNQSMNHSIGRSSFQIIYGIVPHHVMDFVPLPV